MTEDPNNTVGRVLVFEGAAEVEATHFTPADRLFIDVHAALVRNEPDVALDAMMRALRAPTRPGTPRPQWHTLNLRPLIEEAFRLRRPDVASVVIDVLQEVCYCNGKRHLHDKMPWPNTWPMHESHDALLHLLRLAVEQPPAVGAPPCVVVLLRRMQRSVHPKVRDVFTWQLYRQCIIEHDATMLEFLLRQRYTRVMVVPPQPLCAIKEADNHTLDGSAPWPSIVMPLDHRMLPAEQRLTSATSLLLTAIVQASDACFATLLSYGPCLCPKHGNSVLGGMPPLHPFLTRSLPSPAHTRMFEMLLDAGADIDVCINGTPLMHTAAKHASSNILEVAFRRPEAFRLTVTPVGTTLDAQLLFARVDQLDTELLLRFARETSFCGRARMFVHLPVPTSTSRDVTFADLVACVNTPDVATGLCKLLDVPCEGDATIGAQPWWKRFVQHRWPVLRKFMSEQRWLHTLPEWFVAA